VLIVCAANTARSIMAEHMLRRELRERGIDSHVQVVSAGIAPYARDGALVSLDTRLALRDDHIHIGEEATSTDLKRHPELLEQCDVITLHISFAHWGWRSNIRLRNTRCRCRNAGIHWKWP